MSPYPKFLSIFPIFNPPPCKFCLVRSFCTNIYRSRYENKERSEDIIAMYSLLDIMCIVRLTKKCPFLHSYIYKYPKKMTKRTLTTLKFFNECTGIKQ